MDHGWHACARPRTIILLGRFSIPHTWEIGHGDEPHPLRHITICLESMGPSLFRNDRVPIVCCPPAKARSQSIQGIRKQTRTAGGVACARFQRVLCRFWSGCVMCGADCSACAPGQKGEFWFCTHRRSPWRLSYCVIQRAVLGDQTSATRTS